MFKQFSISTLFLIIDLYAFSLLKKISEYKFPYLVRIIIELEKIKIFCF